ncbi:MAG: helix-turn-helix domain-containing protein [Adhaeribacter sp.]
MSTIQVLQFILVGGALQGLFLAFLLATRQANQLANRLLASLIILISFQSILVAFDTREFFLAFPHLSKISWLLPFLFGPLIYLFTKKLTHEQPQFKLSDLIHFIPFGLTFIYLLPYYLKTRSEKIAYLNDFELARQDDFGWLGQVTLFLILFYLMLSAGILRKYERKILDTFSELEKIRLQWLKQFIYALLIILFLATVAFYAKKWTIPVLTEIYHYHIHYWFVIILIYWIGYKTLAQPRIFTETASHKNQDVALTQIQPGPEAISVSELSPAIGPPVVAQNKKYQKSILKETESQAYLDQLLAFMETEKPYRESNITIQELADSIGLPKHHLSQVINDRLGKNFYDFINQYRVAEAQLMLVDPKYRHLTNLAVAEEAGFNSKATFNAVFKKQTGQTPSEYVRNHTVQNV